MGGFQHGVPCTWQLLWLAVDKSWLALAGPFPSLGHTAYTAYTARNGAPRGSISGSVGGLKKRSLVGGP